MNEVNLTLQENEANILLQLIDSAVKSQGLQVAEAGAFLATKIREQSQPQMAQPELKYEPEEEAPE